MKGHKSCYLCLIKIREGREDEEEKLKDEPHINLTLAAGMQQEIA